MVYILLLLYVVKVPVVPKGKNTIVLLYPVRIISFSKMISLWIGSVTSPLTILMWELITCIQLTIVRVCLFFKIIYG